MRNKKSYPRSKGGAAERRREREREKEERPVLIRATFDECRP